MLTAVDRKGQTATDTYDPLNRRTGASYADGASTAWTYDLAGRPIQMQDSIGGTIRGATTGSDGC